MGQMRTFRWAAWVALAAAVLPAAVQDGAKTLNPWGRQKAGAWFRYRTLAGAEETFADTGLKGREPGGVLLSVQKHPGAATEVSEASPTVKVGGAEALTVGTQTWHCEIQESGEGAARVRRWVLREGRHAGAVIQTESGGKLSPATKVWEHEIVVKGKSFDCLVVEDGSTKTWTCQALPLGFLKREAADRTVTLVDFGADWGTRPAPPGPAPAPAPKPAPAQDDAAKAKQALDEAGRMLKEATPLFQEVTAAAEALPADEAKLKALGEKGARAEKLLSDSHKLYSDNQAKAPNPEAVKDRLETLGELIATIKESNGKIRGALGAKPAPPKPEPPKPEVAKPEPPKPEPPKPVPPKPEPPKPEVAKPEPPKPAPPKPEPPKPPPQDDAAAKVKLSLDEAARMLKEATPLFQEVTGASDALPADEARLKALAEKGGRAETLLEGARKLYADNQAKAPNPEAVKDRLETLAELLAAIKESNGKIKGALAARPEPPKPVPPKPEPPRPEVAKPEPPKPEPPKPEPPKPVPPKPEVAKPEPPKPEPPKPVPPKPEPPKPEVAKPEPPKPVPPKPEDDAAAKSKLALEEAGRKLKEATPLFQEVTAATDSLPGDEAKLKGLSEKGARAEALLEEARKLYADNQAKAPNPEAVKDRLETLAELLTAIRESNGKVKGALAAKPATPPDPVKPAADPGVAKALEDAARMIKEATPLFQEATQVAAAPPADAAKIKDALEKGGRAETLLEDARKLYADNQTKSPEPAATAKRVEDITGLLVTLREDQAKLKGALAAAAKPARTGPVFQDIPDPILSLDDPLAGRVVDLEWFDFQPRIGIAYFSEDYHIDPSPCITLLARAPLPWLSPTEGSELFGLFAEVSILPGLERELDPEPDQATGTAFFLGMGLDLTLLRNQSFFFKVQGGFQYGSYGGITGLSEGMASTAGATIGIYMGKSVTITINDDVIFGRAGDYVMLGTLGMLFEF